MFTVSVVSHGQGALVARLPQDHWAHCTVPSLQVRLTLDTGECLPFEVAEFPFEIRILCNAERREFAANHNAAFAQARGEYCFALNSDIRRDSGPFPALVPVLVDTAVGVVGSPVSGTEGRTEGGRVPAVALIVTGAIQLTLYVSLCRHAYQNLF